MNNIIKKIRLFIEKNSEESLFLFDSDGKKNENYLNYFIEALNFEHPACFEVIDHTQWLFFCSFGPLGFYTDKNENSAIITINEQGYFDIFCKNIQDIPLEILRRRSKEWNERYLSINLYIRDNDLYRIPQFIKTYEKWALNHGIMLDPNNLYYDQYGQIFKNYFDIEYHINNLILPTKEEQDFTIHI